MAEYIVRESGYPGTIKKEIVGEIVRCRDCKHFINHDKRCGLLNHGMKDDDFCSKGERRDE